MNTVGRYVHSLSDLVLTVIRLLLMLLGDIIEIILIVTKKIFFNGKRD